MHRSFILTVLWLAVIFTAYGDSVEIPVTPTSLDTYFYKFSVSTNAAPSGIAFHVTMVAKKDDIVTNDSGASLAIVTRTKTSSGGLLYSGHMLDSSIPVTLKKEKRRWAVDFVVPNELLKNPDLYFNFNFLGHTLINGKSITMPSVTSYQIRLEDFTGQISDALLGRWQASSGDTYEFTKDGEYERWLQKPTISKSAQADASEPSNRKGLLHGKYSIRGNSLVLNQNDGTGSTNEFYITKGKVNETTGKFFGSGYSFIILSAQSESNWSISKYELMYH